MLFIVDGVWWCGGMLGCAKWLRYHNNQMSDSASSRRLSKVIAPARHYTKVSSVLWLNLAPIKSFPQVRQHEHTISPAHCSSAHPAHLAVCQLLDTSLIAAIAINIILDGSLIIWRRDAKIYYVNMSIANCNQHSPIVF